MLRFSCKQMGGLSVYNLFTICLQKPPTPSASARAPPVLSCTWLPRASPSPLRAAPLTLAPRASPRGEGAGGEREAGGGEREAGGREREAGGGEREAGGGRRGA